MKEDALAIRSVEHWLGKEDTEPEVRNEDPNKSITRWLTNAAQRLTHLLANPDRIRLKSRHQQEFVENYEWYGSPFGSGNPGYTFAAHLHAAHSISIDGEGRKEAVYAMTGLNGPELDFAYQDQLVYKAMHPSRGRNRKLRTFNDQPPDQQV